MHPERPSHDRPADALEARLRALPPPAVPAGLEARLLATIPAERPTARRRWAVLIGALAAACLLALLAWQRRGGNESLPSPGKGDSANRVALDDSARIAAGRQARRVLDGEEPPTFAWPLDETSPLTVSTAIPPELLD